MTKVLSITIGIFAAVMCTATAADSSSEAIVLKSGVPLLFADDSVLESRSDVVRVVHQGKMDAQPAVVDTEPWERNENGYGQTHMYGSVYPKEDGTGYRMWYGGIHSRVLVADSVDGVNWTKPKLNICEIGGSATNNVVIKSLAGPSVLRDSFEKNPARRYKIVGCHYYKPDNPRTGFYTMTSPDGLHWSEERQIVRGWWDTSTLSQNPYTGEYLVYHKHEIPELGCKRRVVFLTKSRDFVNWTEPVRVFGADEADDGMWVDNPAQFTDVYMMSVVGYAGGFIGIPSLFRVDRILRGIDKGRFMSPHDGPLFLGFAVSHDGERWSQLPGRRPVLPNNPYGVYNATYPGCSSGGPGTFLHVGDETWLYVYCSAHGHGTGYPKGWSRETGKVPQWSIGRAVWRRWGFVSLEAKNGHCRTRTLRLLSNRMTVNFKRLENGGSVKVVAIAPDGKILATAKADGDGARQPLVWNRPLPIDEPLSLQFEITRGALYSAEVE